MCWRKACAPIAGAIVAKPKANAEASFHPEAITRIPIARRSIRSILTLVVFRLQYRGLLDTYFAENFGLDAELDLECLRIPHFYHAFYVYKYATGISAAATLSQRVLAGEPRSVEAYLNFLRSGGSKFPLETLKTAGVDMTTSAPIEST